MGEASIIGVDLAKNGLCPRSVSPRHQCTDILVEMAVREPGEQFTQIGVGFHAIHLAPYYSSKSGRAAGVPAKAL